jgi:sterol desaturase/sphingolipid hydroxylase (fatty acid hydroxylase superfamily)
MAQVKKTFVSKKDESPRLFDNDIMDYFSRVYWWVPAVIYVPVIAFFAYKGIAIDKVAILPFVLLFFGGMAMWTFFEYMVHRFIFHYHPTNETLKKIHYVAHGVHHDYPQDSMRLVMPPTVSIPLAFITYGLTFLVCSLFDVPEYTATFFAGFVLGYLLYDLLHYATHHAKWRNSYFQWLKAYHMKHHYVDPDAGYGITNDFWDKLFRTGFKK